jgi:hypothetical protein
MPVVSLKTNVEDEIRTLPAFQTKAWPEPCTTDFFQCHSIPFQDALKVESRVGTPAKSRSRASSSCSEQTGKLEKKTAQMTTKYIISK